MTEQSKTVAKQFFTSPLFWALFLPLGIGIFKPRLILYLYYAVEMFIYYLPVFIALQVIIDFHINDRPIFASIFKRLLPLPGGLVYGTDLDAKDLPLLTIGLIIINTLIFFALPKSVVHQYTLFPFGDPSWWQIAISFFTSAFLHVDLEHLWGNMLFLWVFSSVLEVRLGWKRMLVLYCICILASDLFILLYASIKYPSIMDYHCLGASGAISGVMGIFAVRCFFARVKFAVPLFGGPFGAVPVKVQGVILIGLYFFAFDVVCAGHQLKEGSTLNIGYWAHVGGYLGGILLGYALRLNKDATKEAIQVKAERLSDDSYNRAKVRKLSEEILKQDPKNEKALLVLFQANQWRKQVAGGYYARLMKIYLANNHQKAVELSAEYYPEYINRLPTPLLVKLGSHHHKRHKLKEAAWCLEMVVGREDTLQTKATLMLGEIYDDLGNTSMARRMFVRVAIESEDQNFKNVAQRLMGLLPSS